MFGLREIASGVGILTCRRPAGWLWARVGGDLVDLACLGTALKSETAKPGRTTTAIMAVVGVTVLDLLAGEQLSRGRDTTAGKPNECAVRVQMTLTVNRPPEDVYRFWRDFHNLSQFMSHLEAVQVTGEKSLHWRAKAPTGTTVEWEVEITGDQPNEPIAWRSLAISDVDHTGSVRFERAPGGRGTEIRVEMSYNPPGGVLGTTVANLFGAATGQQVRKDLRRFKQLIETSEIARSEIGLPGAHAARPPTAVTNTYAGKT
jgi:uncharacterized membrane protein